MGRVDVDGVGISWHEVGREDAPAVVFLHSLGSDGSMWAPQAEALAPDYRVVLPDMRGHGASDAPSGPYSMARLVADVTAIADAAGIDRFHLCGLSIGGQMTLSAAGGHQDRIASAIACNTSPRFGTDEFWRARIAAIREGGMESIRETVIDRWFAGGFADNHPDWFAEANAVFASTPVEGYIGCCEVLATSDLRDSVSSISLPTLVVGGELDISALPAESEWLHSQIPGSRLEIIAGAAHLSNLDRPEVFTELVRDWLSEQG